MLNTILPSTQQATALLTPRSTDASIGLLNKLFGIPNGQWHSIYYQTVGGIGQGSLFFNLLSDLDTVVLAWVAVTILIVMGIGAMNTAHEGKSLGQRYHTIWTPVRSATALVMLSPIPGVGLSLIQGVVLLMIWFSIGGANYLATTAMTYMAKNGGQITSIAPQNGQQLADDILFSEITQAYFVNYENAPAPSSSNTVIVSSFNGPSTGPGYYLLSFNTLGISGFNNNQLGAIKISCLTPSGPVCSAELSAVKTMVNMEYPYAQTLVNETQAKAGSSSLNVTNPSAASGTGTTADSVTVQAAQVYDAAITGARQQVLAQANPQLTQAMDALTTNVTHMGWWSLGMYYWDIAAVNSGIQAHFAKPTRWFGYDAKLVKKTLDSKTDEKRLAGIQTAAVSNVNVAQNASSPTNSHMNSLSKILDDEGVFYAKPAAWLMEGDPVSNLQTVGEYMVNIEFLSVAGSYIDLRGIASGLKNAADHIGIPLVSGIAGGAAGTANGGLKAAGPYVFAALFMILMIGATWAYYLPSVPFIVWTFSIIGWLIFLIEALVGSVLWAAAIALPEGEGIVGPRGDQGVMLLLSAMFYPSLMVIGLFAGFVLMNAVGSFVGSSLSVFMGSLYSVGGSDVSPHAFFSMSTATALNPITWIATSALATVIIVALAHKIFGLVTWLPENVFRWVGGQGVQLGAPQDEQNVRAGFAGFASGKSKAHEASANLKASSSSKGPAPKAESEGAKGDSQGQGEQGAATGGNKVAGGGTRTDPKGV